MPARRTAAALAATALLVLTGCGGDGEDDPTVAVPTTGASSSAPTTTTSAPAGAAGGTLTALVGTADNPEAFELSLTDASGAKVTQLAAGTYTIKVTDQSTIHNFALRGEGVEMQTGVRDKENPTWRVELKAGDYTFTCTPHPSMSGSFTVA